MSVGVLVAVEHHLESGLVTGIEAASGIEIVRRCADAAELLSAAAAGLADVAVISPGFRGIEREGLRTLAGHGLSVVGLVPDGDEAAERRLRQLGVSTVLPAGSDGEVLAATLTDPSGVAGIGGAGGVDTRARLGRGPAALLPADPWPAGSPLGDEEALSRDGGLDWPDAAVAAPDWPDAPQARTGRTTAVWGPTGAPGRSTIATALATLLAARGIQTLLLDLDTWGASVAQLLGLVDEAPGVAAAARAAEQGTLDVPTLSRIAPEVTPGLRVLTGLPSPERWPEARAGAVEHLLDVARRLVDHVVVDCGFALEDDEELSYDTAAPRRNAATLTALEQADDLVVVGAADPVGLGRLVRGMSALAAVRSPHRIVVVNKVRASVAGAHPERSIAEVLGRFAGLTELTFIPWAPEECDAALLAGRAVTEFAPDGAMARAVGPVLPMLRPELADGDSRATRRGRRAGRGR